MKINYNNTFIDVALEDDAKVSFELMGDNVIQLHYQLPEWIEIPVGATIEWQGKEYVMYEDMEFTKHGTRSWDYQLKFYPVEYRLKHWKMRNPIDNRLQYTMSLSPKTYIEHIVEALNKRDRGWSVGECIDAPEQVVAFDHSFIYDSLMEQAEVFKTELEIIGKTIHLRKIEKNKDNPLPLAYGKGNGFVPGVGRKNTSDKIPFSTLYVQGGEQNINYSTYGSRFLLLPRNQSIAYDGERFSDEEGFIRENSRIYVSSADGLCVTREGKRNNDNDESLDLSTIYPNRLERIVEVDIVDANKNWYDIVIDAPANLDYRNWQIDGETPTITFQSGMLGGKTFDLETKNNGEIICEQITDGENHIGWKLQIVPTEIDGLMMPGDMGYLPAVDDTLRVFGITLPNNYICDNENRKGASWEMFREAVKYMYDNEDKKFTFTGQLQAKWVRENYLNVMGYLEPGSYVLFRDEQFDREGVMVRVTAVSYPLNNPYEVKLTISNEVEGKTAGTTLRNLEQEKIKAPAREQDIIQYTQRGFRDLKETTNMLSQAVSGFDEGIKPVFVETMQTIVGDERLQYEFTDSTYTNVVASIINYNEQKQIVMPQQYIRHRTLGITTIAPTHDYLHWQISSYTSAILSDVDKAYYLYVKASKINTTATMYISEQPMQDTEMYYYLLFAIVNKENNGTRSVVTLNSYTEILPGRITTDKIVSADGQTYFDLNKNEIGGNINFKDGLVSGLIRMNDENGETKAAINALTGSPLDGNIGDFAFAAGITNADQPNADALIILKQNGEGSKIGLFGVEKHGIKVSPDNANIVSIVQRKDDDIFTNDVKVIGNVEKTNPNGSGEEYGIYLPNLDIRENKVIAYRNILNDDLHGFRFNQGADTYYYISTTKTEYNDDVPNEYRCETNSFTLQYNEVDIHNSGQYTIRENNIYAKILFEKIKSYFGDSSILKHYNVYLKLGCRLRIREIKYNSNNIIIEEHTYNGGFKYSSAVDTEFDQNTNDMFSKKTDATFNYNPDINLAGGYRYKLIFEAECIVYYYVQLKSNYSSLPFNIEAFIEAHQLDFEFTAGKAELNLNKKEMVISPDGLILRYSDSTAVNKEVFALNFTKNKVLINCLAIQKESEAQQGQICVDENGFLKLKM